MKKRDTTIDILKSLSIIGIIMIHVMGNTINTLGLTGTPKVIYEVITNICYIAIPTFVMISGVNFLNKDITIKEMFKKYLLKIIIALITFGLFYSALEIFFLNHTLTINDIKTCFENILTGNLWAHMWYLYLVIALYLITPVLRVITKNATEHILKYFLIILFIFSFTIPEVSKIFNINLAFYILISGSYLFYYIYGYYIYYHTLSNTYKNISYVLGFISFITVIYLTIKNTNMYLISYTSTLIFLIANAIFIFITSLKNSQNKFITNLGKYSFGIYITHQIYINIIYKCLKLDWILTNPYLGLIIYTIFILLISYIVVHLVKKIKFIDKYVI